MKHKARISRLRRLLMARHVNYPPFIIHITDDADSIVETHTIHLRF